jgi:hypothetical protein
MPASLRAAAAACSLAAVRRFLWQRWMLIFLLMARLVIGEMGHAMPVTGMAPLAQATTEMATEAACPEHESGPKQHPVTHHGDAADDATAHSDGEHDCCKSGDCECPCLHVPCVALDATMMNPVSIALLRIPHGADSVTATRPSRLFRPPA